MNAVWLAALLTVNAPAATNRVVVQAALHDAASLQLLQHNTHTTRYVWVKSDDPMERAGHVLIANSAMSYVSLPVHPRWVKLPGGWLAAWDLLHFADSKETLASIIKVWEKLADERYFHQPCKGGFLVPNGGRCVKVVGDGQVTPAIYLGQEAVQLAKILKTDAPIVRWDNFLVRVGSTIDHDYGEGLYYQFRGIEGLSLDDLLKSLGADKALLFNTERAALTSVSKVTGHNRRIRFLKALATPVGVEGAIVYTEDTGDASTDDDQDVFRNLDKSRFDAIRLFFPLPNGLQGTWLGDGKGQQQTSAPDTVASNDYLGFGTQGTRRLHGGVVSCGACHVAESKSWFQPIENDFLKLSKELTAVKDGREDSLGLLQKYQWNPEDSVLPRFRESYDQAVDRLALPYVPSAENLTPLVWATISKRFNTYVHGEVDLKEALAELGYPGVARRLGYPVLDTTVALLNAGGKVRRHKFERIYADLALLDALSRGVSVLPYTAGSAVQSKPQGKPQTFGVRGTVVPGHEVYYRLAAEANKWHLVATSNDTLSGRFSTSLPSGKYFFTTGVTGRGWYTYDITVKEGQNVEHDMRYPR